MSPSPRLMAALLLVCTFALVAFRFRPPSPEPLEAEASRFSAARAVRDLEAILPEGRPHPVGSVENGAVAERLEAALRARGLAVTTRGHTVCPSGLGFCTELRNLVAVREAGPDVILVAAHYDSVPAGMGAADDGAAIGVILEAARWLEAKGPSRNTVAFLLSDGEEVGLLGAAAFVRDNPLWRRVRVVVNLEARGTQGPSLMFEAHGPTELVASRLGALPRPVTSSLFAAIYERLPNDTDFTVLTGPGVIGYNFAFIDAVPRYHTSIDDLAHLDAGSVQHHGDNVVALLGAFLDAPLGAPAAGAGEAVWFDVLSAGVIRWPREASLWLALAASILVLVTGLRATASDGTRWTSVGLGVALPLGAVVIAVAVGFGLAALLGAGDRGLFPRTTRTLLPFLGSLAAGVGSSLVVARAAVTASPWGLFTGVWLLWSLLAVILALLFPPACHLFVAPAVVAGLLGAILARRPWGTSRLAWLAAGVMPALLWWQVALGITSAMGVLGHPVVTAASALVVTSLLPLLAARPRSGTKGPRDGWGLPLRVFGFAILVTLVALWRSPFDAEHPQRLSILHLQQAEGASYGLDTTWGALPEGLAALVPGAVEGPPPLPLHGVRRMARAPAPRIEATPLAVDVYEDAAPRRRSFRVRSTRGADVTGVLLPPEPSVASHLRINGEPVEPLVIAEGPFAGQRLALCLSSGSVGCTFTLSGSTEGVRVLDWLRGLPREAEPLVQARAAAAGVPSQEGDLSIVVQAL
ncbi:MAG: M28 family peptidase [Polyangiaceae bacterium]